MKPKEIVNMKSDRQYTDSMTVFCIAALGFFATLILVLLIN